MNVQAEVSLYPLRTRAVGRPIREFLSRLEDGRAVVKPGNMSTTVAGSAEDVFTALKHAFIGAASARDVVMILKVSNACPPAEGLDTENPDAC